MCSQILLPPVGTHLSTTQETTMFQVRALGRVSKKQAPLLGKEAIQPESQ